MLNYHFGGLNVFGFHAVNFILHVLCAGLVYCLVRQTQKCCGCGSWGEFTAFFSTLIFLVHPLQTQAVTYVVQRSTLLAAFFYLLGLLVYLKLRLTKRRVYYYWAWGIVALGVMTKPIFATLPLTILFYEICFFDLRWSSFKKNFLIFLPFLCALIIVPVFLILFSLQYLSETFDLTKLSYATRLTPEISRLDYWLTELGVLAKYLRLLFIPVGQNLDYDYPIAHSLFEIKTFLSFLLLLAVGVFGVFNFQKQRMISFGIGWFFIVLIPESSIFPLPDVIFEHRLYLAMVGFAIVLCTQLACWVKDKRLYIFCLSMIILSFSILTFARNVLWANPLAFLQDIVKKSPYKARPHNNLGLFYQEMGIFDLAQQASYQKAIFLDEKYLAAYNNLGQLYAKRGNYKRAEEQFKKILQFNSNHYEANLNLGNLYYNQAKFDLADSQYKKAMNINPHADTPYLNLGNIYLRFNNFGDAQKMFEQAIKNNPDFDLAYYSLGNCYIAQQDFLEAIRAFRRAIAINPNYVDAYNTLGIAYDNLRNFEQGERYFKKAIALNPDYTIAYLNLAHHYRKTGDQEMEKKFSEAAKNIQERRKDVLK